MADLVFVFDRTSEDVERARMFRGREYASLTPTEQVEFDSGLKGAYNAADLRRVDGNLTSIAKGFTAMGYPVSVTPAQAWQESDLPTADIMERIRQDLARVRAVLPPMAGAPPTPSTLNPLDYEKANDIERILFAVHGVKEGIALRFRISGAFTAGNSVAAQTMRR